MIVNFKNHTAEIIWQRKFAKNLPHNISSVARRKLLQLDSAQKLDDLRIPPGNRLELLDGDRQGQYSIRINDQWRICFIWQDGHAHQVEIIDYH